MKILALVVFFTWLSLQRSPAQMPAASSAPVSDLGHIDIILDSATWYTIKNDSFIQNQFGLLNIDTAYYGGKPSYDLYVLGHLNFLHLSLAEGFWKGQEGGGAIVFQTQKPGQKDLLSKSWERFYKDSLLIHTFKGSDFSLDEVMAWYKADSTGFKEGRVFANLTSYSVDAYKNWGITDTVIDAGLSMKQFMADWGGKSLQTRLFNSITELHMTINRKEYKEIKSALLATGYSENKNIFMHSFNPTVYITASEEKGRSKYSKVKFTLGKSVASKQIVLNPNTVLHLSGKEGWLIFK